MEKQPVVLGNQDGGTTSSTTPAFYVLVKQPQGNEKVDHESLTSNQDGSGLSSSAAVAVKSKVRTSLPADCVSGGITVTLDNNSMWNEFYHRRTEMILTKQGRRMFPYCRYWISGLESNLKYILVMDISPVDNFRYKWNGRSWEPSGKAEPHVLGRVFIHPESPSTGHYWMHQPISFYKLKLTNNTLDQEGHIILHSMHRYLPRLHLVPADKATEVIQLNGPDVHTYSFPQTEFFAVTAYQNIQITQLKIDYNPFAKGFREDGLSSKPQRDLKQNGNSEQEGGSVTSSPSNDTHLTEGDILDSEQRDIEPSFSGRCETDLEKDSLSPDHNFLGFMDTDRHVFDRLVFKQETPESPIGSPCQSNSRVASPLNSNGDINVVVKEEPIDDYDYGSNVCMEGISVKQEEADETEEYFTSDDSVMENKLQQLGEMGRKEIEIEARKRRRSRQLGVAKAKMLKLDSGKLPVVYLEPCAVTRDTVKVSALSQAMLLSSKSEKSPFSHSVDSLPTSLETSPYTATEMEEMAIENHLSENNIPHRRSSGQDLLWKKSETHSSLTMTKTGSICNPIIPACNDPSSAKDESGKKNKRTLKNPVSRKGIDGNQKVVAAGQRKRGRPRKIKSLEIGRPPTKCSGKSTTASSYASLRHIGAHSDIKPDLEDVDGVLFVSFASREALDIHTVDRSEEREELQKSQTPSLATCDPYTDPDGQRIRHLEKELLEDLKSFKHKQVIHPSLQEVGLKLNFVDPTMSIDLTYLGVQLPLGYSEDCALWKTQRINSSSADSGLPFVSRTGKTNDFTKIKGWREKLHSSSKNDGSILEGSLKNRSAFCSDKLDEYLENEGKLMETSMEFSPSASSCPVVYQLPTKSTSYVRTLDSVLKKQSTITPSSSYTFKPLSVPSVSRKKRKKIKKKQAVCKDRGKPPSKSAISLPILTKQKCSVPVLEEKVAESQPVKQAASEVVPSIEESVPGKQVPMHQAQQQQQGNRPPSLSKTQLKLMDLEDCALWDGKPRTYITNERAELSLTTLLTAQASLKNKPIHKIIKRRAPPCNKDFCRLGCICVSLALEKRQPTHCRKPDCMFGCTCLKRKVVLVKGSSKHKKIVEKHEKLRLLSGEEQEQELEELEKEEENEKMKLKDKKRRKKVEYSKYQTSSNQPTDPELYPLAAICDTEPEKPVVSFPLWVKVDGEMDPEPVYVPTQPATESTKPATPPTLEITPPEPKPAPSVVKPVPSAAKPGRVYIPRPNPVIREEDKDPVYLYFESMMTCARVRLYEHKVREKKQPPKCPWNSENVIEKEYNSVHQSLKMAEDKELKEKSWWFSCSPGDPSTSYVHHVTPDGTTKLIEITSDCNWEEDRNEILNVLSQHIRNRMPKSLKVGNFVIDLESENKTLDEKNTPIYSSRVKISRQAIQNKKEKPPVSVLESANNKLSPSKKSEQIPLMPSTLDKLQAKKKKGLPFYTGPSPAGKLVAYTCKSNVNPSCLIQVNGKNYPQAKLLLGQMGALHPASRLAAYITGRLRPTMLDLSTLSTVISKVASRAKCRAPEAQPVEVLVPITPKAPLASSTNLVPSIPSQSIAHAPAQKQIVPLSTALMTTASTATAITLTSPTSCSHTGPSGIHKSPLPNQKAGAQSPTSVSSPPRVSPGGEKCMGPRLLLIPVHQGSPPSRPPQNMQLGQGKRMILQPLRNPGGVNLYRHPNGQIIQLVPLHQLQPTGSQSSLPPVPLRNPGSVVGIRLPGPSKSPKTAICQFTSVSPVTPTTTAISILSMTPSVSFTTLSTEGTSILPVTPSTTTNSRLPGSSAALPTIATTEAPSSVPAASITEATSALSVASTTEASLVLPGPPTTEAFCSLPAPAITDTTSVLSVASTNEASLLLPLTPSILPALSATKTSLVLPSTSSVSHASPMPAPSIADVTSVLSEAPTNEASLVLSLAPSILPALPAAKTSLVLPSTSSVSHVPATTVTTSASPVLPTEQHTVQNIRSVPPSSATQASSIIPPASVPVSQAGTLTLRISPAGIKNIITQPDEHSNVTHSTGEQPSNTPNLISLECGSFALLQFPREENVPIANVKQATSVDAKDTNQKVKFSVIKMEGSALLTQEVDAMESEITTLDSKPEGEKILTNLPDSLDSEGIACDKNANTVDSISEIVGKNAEPMEQLSSEASILQPDVVSSDHSYISEKAKCEEIGEMVKKKQYDKLPEGTPDKVPFPSETTSERCLPTAVLAFHNALKEQDDAPDLKNSNEEHRYAGHTQSPAVDSEGTEKFLETCEQPQKLWNKQEVPLDCTAKLQQETKSYLEENKNSEFLTGNKKDKNDFVTTVKDSRQEREKPKFSSAKDQNNEPDQRDVASAQEVLPKRKFNFLENSSTSNNKRGTIGYWEEIQTVKDKLVQVGRTWSKISSQSVALESKSSLGADEHLEKFGKCVEQKTLKNNYKKDFMPIIDITMEDTEKEDKTDDSADDMVNEISGYHSEDTVNVETWNESESCEEDGNVDVETVEELSEKINLARLKATASRALASKQLHIVRDQSNKAIAKTTKQSECTIKKPKNEEEAFANYRQTHTANERRRRREMRSLFEKLETTLGLHVLPKVSKCFILKQAFEEIQGLTDQADKLTGQKNLLMRKQDTLIRKVSALSGKPQEVVLKKLEYIYAKQKAVEAQKQQQQAVPVKTDETAEVSKSSTVENSPSSPFKEMKQVILSERRTKPLILSRKGNNNTGETSSPMTLTNASLVMTSQGQVLTFKSPMMPGQVPTTLLQAGLKSEIDSSSGTTQPGITSVMIQLPSSAVPVQVKGILPNSTIPITLSAVPTSPTSPVVETTPEFASENEDSFMMPRIVNVTSLATETDTNLNQDLKIHETLNTHTSEPCLQAISEKTTKFQSEEKSEASFRKERDATRKVQDFHGEKESFPQLVKVACLKEAPASFASEACVEELPGSQPREKQIEKRENRQKPKDSSFPKLQVKEPKDSGLEMELQKVASALEEAALDPSDLMDMEENDDADETLTSLLNEIAFLNQQLNDDASDLSELPNSPSSGVSPGDLESRQQSAAADASPFQFGPLGGSFKDDLSVVRDNTSGSITPLLLHLEDEDEDDRRNSGELSSESDALKIMLTSGVKNASPDHSSIANDENETHLEPLGKTASLSPPILQMKTNLDAGNTDTAWRPMPKLAPLGLKAVNFPLESEGQNTKMMPLLSSVSAKGTTEITAQPETGTSQDSKAMPILAPIVTKSK